MKAKRGFTLIEAIVALTIFTIVMAALSFSLNIALKADSLTHQREDDTGSVRVIFDALTRDIQAAFASPNSPASVFVAGGGNSGNGSNLSGGGILTLTTLSQHIRADSLMSGDSTDPNASPQTPDMPQSDMALVQYTLEPQNDGSFLIRRSVTPVPNTQLLSQEQGNPQQAAETALAQDVMDLTFQFYDRQQQTWRPDWDFEQQIYQQILQAQKQASSGSSGSGGASGSTPTAIPSGDTMLPGAVKVLLRMRNKEGNPIEYITTIPIVSPQPQPATSDIPTTGGSNATSASGG